MNYELNKDLVHNDMVVEGADGELVGTCGDAEGEGTAGLSAQHVEFPLLGAEGFLQTEDGGLGIIYGYAEAQVAAIEGMRGYERHSDDIVGLALHSKGAR